VNNQTDGLENINLSRKPDVPGLIFRGFRGKEDYPTILVVILGCASVDGIEHSDKLEDITYQYTHLIHCDLYHDMLLAEVEDIVVGFCRVSWMLEASGQWLGCPVGYVLPQWRHKGIGSSLLHFNEERLRQIAAQLKETGQIPMDVPCLLDLTVNESEIDRINLLERNNYKVRHYFFEMVRPNLENIPDILLPPGVEVRGVESEHIRLICEATNEAFNDHWGFTPVPLEYFERMTNNPDFDSSLWSIAWQGDQVAAMVISSIFKGLNETFGRKRGYIDNICVRRPWRGQGLAKALIARNLIALMKLGMTEAGLLVDAENKSGALHLYESMGFQVVKREMVYRKPLEI